MATVKHSVFLSSTWRDLVPHRRVVDEALRNAGYDVIRMEQFPAAARPPIKTCLAHLQTADLCVLIVGTRYGSTPDGREKSFTEREYDCCRQEPIAVVPFVSSYTESASDDESPEKLLKLGNFRKRLARHHTLNFFDGPDDLAVKVVNSVNFHFHNIRHVVSTVAVSSLAHSLTSASSPLLSWPQVLPSGTWLERPEMSALLSNLESDSTPLTFLLGPKGAGKSAILARLCQQAISRGFHVLAIKSEFLSSTIASLDDLSEDLHLPQRIDKCIEQCVRSRPTLLAIDQLDALCELCDLKSGRLNVILHLIARCKPLNNLKIVASCRDFDFHNDTRVSVLDGNRIDLALPSWDEVNKELCRSGVENADSWPEPSRLLLRTPEYLRQFLLKVQGTKDRSPFQTYHQLFDDIWTRGVNTPAKAEIVHSLTVRLLNTEEHWAPAALFDQNHLPIQQLQSNGILRLVDSKIGFCHQTMLEHAKARYFTTVGGSLIEHIIRHQGALFIRPTLWITLGYLRAVDIVRYSSELRALFASPIRLHIAFLLISFVGQQQEPTPTEIELLAAQLTDHRLRTRVLISIIGQPRWYDALRRTHFPAVANWPVGDMWALIPVLSNAFSFAREDSLSFVDRYLLPDPSKDDLTRQLFYEFSGWNIKCVERVRKLIDRAPTGRAWWAEDLVSQISAESPTLAPKIAAAALIQQTAKKSAGDGMENHDAGKCILDITQSWHSLPAVAEASPSEFLIEIWPLLTDWAERTSHGHFSSVLNAYPGHNYHLAADNEHSLHYPVAEALRIAVRKCAMEDSQTFYQTTRKAWSIPCHAVQQLIAEGLASGSRALSSVALEYLSGDPRRLYLYAYGSGRRHDHFYSVLLIAAIATHLSPAEISQLESIILNWSMYRSEADVSSEQLQWQEDNRQLLMLAVPYKLRGAAIVAAVGAAPLPPMPTPRSAGGFVRELPALSSDDVKDATDSDIINALRVCRPSSEVATEWPEGESGGVRRFSYRAQVKAISTLFEGTPERASNLLVELFKAGFEKAVAECLRELDKTSLTSDAAVELTMQLAKLGAASDAFRESACYIFYRRCESPSGLPDQTCELIRKWLPCNAQSSHTIPDDPSDEREQHPTSVLWGEPTIGIVDTDTDFWALLALTRGYLTRIPPDTTQWLDVVEEQVNREPDARLWKAYCPKLLSLCIPTCDSQRGIKVVADLFQSAPDVLLSCQGAILVAGIEHLTDDARLGEWLERLRDSSWSKGRQAFGELATLIAFRDCDRRPWLHSLVSDCVRRHREPLYSDIAVGIAFAAARLWDEPEVRESVADVLIQMIPGCDERLAEAVGTVFLTSEEFPADATTERFLNCISANPSVLVGRCSSDLVPHLPTLLPHCRTSVLNVCRTLLAHQETMARTGWNEFYTAGPHLVAISITLQRYEDTRAGGLDLFESLLRLGMDEAYRCLNEIDLRPGGGKPRPPRPRRRRISRN